jgi:di/tricarboxylate transporter
MTRPAREDTSLVRDARLVAGVIAAAAVLWLGAQWLGGRDARYVFLFDMAAIAAFIWALVATWRIWRRGQRPQGK